jgi:Flp pilus assembly protein TadD
MRSSPFAGGLRLSHGAAVVGILALAVRLAFLAEARQFETFRSPVVDALTYDGDARAVAAEGPAALELPYYQPPGYPLLLGAIYALTGGSWTAPRVAQAVAGAVTAALVFLLAARLGGRRAAWPAGLLMAFHLHALYLEGELLPPAWILLLDTAALLLLADAERRGDRIRRPVLAALLLGLSTVLRPTALVLAAGAAAWWVSGPSRPGPRRALIALAALALPVLPITLANVIGGKSPVLVSWNGGINFYLGNGSDPDSLTSIQPGFAWDRLQVEPLRNGVTTRSGESAYWVRRGLREAAADPAAWAAALGRKALRLLDRRETARNTDWEAYRPRSRVLSLPLPGFGVIVPLALLGCAAPGVDRRARALLLVAVAAVAAENLAFFVAGRYRLQAVPALCALAGAGIAAIVSAPGRIPRAAVAGAVALAVATQVDFLGERDVDEARAAINRGAALRRAGDDAGAVREFETALAISPDDPDAHCWRGELALSARDPQRALAHFDRALAVAPDYLRVLLGKASALERLGREADAEPVYRAALEVDPWSTDVRLNYGVWLAVNGRHEEARRQFEVGLRIDPGDDRLRRNLARLSGGS